MKNNKTLIGVAVVVAMILIYGISGYNSLVSVQEKATTALADMQSAYKRRADLIPNLVNTVKGYAQHEKETFEAVTNARAKATQITLDANNLTPEKLQEFQNAQSELSMALGKLMLVKENYPELKADEHFLDLQKQLEGTENRINEMRMNYNKVVENYNKTVRSFPKNVVAGMFGFERMSKFEATESEMKTPEVQF